MAIMGHSGMLVLAVLAFIGFAQADLQMNFYAKSCPNAEKIVLDYVHKHIPNAPSLAAALLRMHFHDCFVRGCDASVLLNFTAASGRATEKTATPNLTLRGFDFIDTVKSLLEAECPGTVSCADIVALVARDSIVTIGGPTWKVPTGRRDGSISSAQEALNNIPPPFFNLTQLKSNFASKGLDVKDLVLLSGAHTVGIAHCPSFSNRLYNFTGHGDEDPSLDSKYAANLKARKCKTPTDNTTIVEMDPGSFRTFDLSYYRLLLKRRGLFQSDAALTTSSTTAEYINELLQGSLNFFSEFASSMQKMGSIEVKTGSDGEIRKKCAVVNS
ncbi:peroxidase 3-like [Diospyros lotus]|uniref:peroxidase 3-like n=1 Tax=Diospyros lotus TaxID=55363 RepID=UPI00225818DD|nr:peroxidase 3-like [Diospyros lotus]